MRTAAQVGTAYAIVLVLSALWRLGPLPGSMPDAVALFAVYLGLTARMQLAPSVLGAIIIGYLGDLLIGTPRGMLALNAGILCVIAHLVHRRLLVRGWVFTMAFTAITAVVSGFIMMALRAYMAAGPGPLGDELLTLLSSAVLTGLAGPPVFRLCRIVDARFARTQRDRMVALEGLIP
jgi:rod shape-determining protein MreD